MKNLIITIVLSVLMFSCSKGGAGDITNPTTGGSGDKEKVLKINTLLYGLDAATGDNYVNISISNSGGTNSTIYGNENENMKELNAGIKITNDSVIIIKVHDKINVEEEYANDILWTGYTFDDVDVAKSKEIEITMEKDINLTLIIAPNIETPVEQASLFFTLNVPENITDAGVKINDLPYTAGIYEVFFAKGQTVALEAIMPANTNIVFTGFYIDGRTSERTSDTVEMLRDTVVEASFQDNTAATATVTITGVKPENGEIFVNGEAIKQATGEAPENYVLKDVSIGQKIILKAEPASGKKFISWSDDLVAYLSDKLEYQYVVTEDAVIKTLFTTPTGVLTVSFQQTTNYFTGNVQHEGNKIKYTVYDQTGGLVQTSDDNAIKHLTWVNNQVAGLQASYKVILEAIPGEGFYRGQKRDDKVEWTGAITGNGLTKTITLDKDATSQAPIVSFEIEKRTITVKLDNKKEIKDGAATKWVDESNTENAKGYSITINGSVVKDMKTASMVFDWHTKVDVKVEGGKHYEATNTIIQGTEGVNPEELYNNATGARVYTLSFDLENDNTTTAVLSHKQTPMTLQVAGGKFDSKIDNKYNGFINVSGTGDTDKDKRYDCINWYDGNNNIKYGEHKISVLSGVPVTLNANTNISTLFRKHTATAPLIAGGSTTTTNAIVANVGDAFTVQSEFYAPIYMLTLNMVGYIQDGSKLIVEADEYKAGNYSYDITPLAGAKSTITDKSKQFPVTNGLPTVIANPLPTTHYTFRSISGVPAGVSTRTIVATDNASVQVDFTHIPRKMKLHILGGKDDRSQSHVQVSGTGLSAYNKNYYASNRNHYTYGAAIAPVEHNLMALSGIKTVKIGAVTSKVHNFDNIITSNGNAVAPVGTHNRGQNTYSQTNSSTITLMPADDTQEVEVQFRINSLGGRLTGLKDDLLFNVVVPKQPAFDKSTYKVYSADELVWLAAQGDTFKGKTIQLMNDIYMGRNNAFHGFKTIFKGKFVGDSKVIYDLDFYGGAGALFREIDGASINGLTTARGKIEAYTTHAGVIGIAQNSIIKNVTNTATMAGRHYIAGIIGEARGGNEVSYIGNYGYIRAWDYDNNAEASTFVGGVIGKMSSTGNKYTYMFNRGSVYGGRGYTSGSGNGSGEGTRVGGVIGGMDGGGTRASKIYNTGRVSGNNPTGGLVGYMGWSRSGDSGDLQIHDFYNTGEVENGQAGVVGIIAGCREIMNNDLDYSMTTTAMNRGYSIGAGTGAGIVTFAGHKANDGKHRINIYNTWFPEGRSSSISGLAAATWLDGRLDGKSQHENLKIHSSGGVKTSGGTYLDTDIAAFSDNNVWVQKSGLPSVNGFVSRPMLKGFEETSIPAYMMDMTNN